jgi:hypothetical protein
MGHGSGARARAVTWLGRWLDRWDQVIDHWSITLGYIYIYIYGEAILHLGAFCLEVALKSIDLCGSDPHSPKL